MIDIRPLIYARFYPCPAYRPYLDKVSKYFQLLVNRGEYLTCYGTLDKDRLHHMVDLYLTKLVD